VKTLADEGTKLLLIDTCGAAAGVALSMGDRLVANEELPAKGASAGMVQAIGRLLEQARWSLRDLDGVGVVSGPGSFTGMRVGMAAAKGLCEATGLPLLAVSRLEVLADATGLRDGLAVLDAGRGGLYVRDVASGREWLSAGEAQASASWLGSRIAVAEAKAAELLEGHDVVFFALHVGDALALLLRRLRESGGGSGLDTALVDANYVREESDIYRKQLEKRQEQRHEANGVQGAPRGAC
jgi:tRNA threonylcarbamoyladenosine biosynthesis protein TsaB